MKEDPLPILLNFFSGIELNSINFENLLFILLLLLLIILSALISGAEVAFFALGSNDIEELEKSKKKHKYILKLLEKPNSLLATILIANNFINVSIVIIASFLTDILIEFPEGSAIEFIFQVILITSILLFFGEITPKLYSNQNPIKFSLMMSYPLFLLNIVFYPLSFILVSSTRIIEKRLGYKGDDINVEEISKALDLTSDLSKGKEDKILRSIVEFGNTDVKEIMKSRVDVVAIDKNEVYTNVLKVVVSSGYSRIPVFEDQFDNILGILYIKDLIPFLDQDDSFNWLELCRPSIFVPETKMINLLLKEFQSKKNHIAIVVDEYGGASGIVTLEDVLEEIVGEINDEFDNEYTNYSKLDSENYIFEGKTLLNDFLKIVEGNLGSLDELKGESDSIAGLILENTGKIPSIGEEIVITPYTFKVESVDLRRIKRVKVTINEI